MLVAAISRQLETLPFLIFQIGGFLVFISGFEFRAKWLFLDDIAAKTGFMVTKKGERAFQGTFYAARFLLNEQDF